MLLSQIHRLIENTALNGGDLCLIVRITNVEVNVRNKEERPFLLGLNGLANMHRLSIETHREAGWRIGLKLRYCYGKALFAKILIGMQRISVVVTGDFKINFSGARTLAIADENIHLFCE